jgi:MinD-like ATPase involved in chromosome partitioning or flagellar assembly
MERPIVLLVLDEADQYVGALRAAGFDPIAGLEAAAERLTTTSRVDLAVLDCDGPRELTSQAYAMLHGDRPIPTLLLFELEPPDFALESPHAGSDEYVRMPVGSDALVYRLQALLIRAGRRLPSESGAWADSELLSEAPVAGEGQAVSVFAPKGGVGKTTLAINLAVALREQTRSSVLLFDADAGVGNVTAMLEVPYTIGLADLAGDEWTDAAFEQAVATHVSGVRVLAWGSDPADAELVTADLLLAALRWARAHHSYVVVDNHPGYGDRTMAMLTVSSEILLVVTPEMGALRNSAQFLELARQVGLGDNIRVVVNRANHGIRMQDMAETLGLPVSATIVSSGPKAVIAANEGKPVISKFPRERISQDLHGIARLVTGHGEAEVPATTRPWWLRFGAKPSTSTAGR